MYILSEELSNRINKIKDTVSAKTNGIVYFEEFITVPYFGFIILRFDMKKESISLNDLDELERILYEIAGNDFMIDFMGSVYKKTGLNLRESEAKFLKFSEKFDNENIDINPYYKKEINNDARLLLEKVGCDLDTKVWEIQLENNEFLLFVLGQENKTIKQIDNITLLEVNEQACTGLVKALFYARRNKVSLGRVLLES